MRLLVLGGTLFLGRHLVETAVAQGHEVTILHRGRTGMELFPGVERVLADRREGLPLPAGRSWDVVVDTSGYLPRVVQLSVDALAGRCGRYVFISSISVYGSCAAPGLTEAAPRPLPDDPSVEAVTGETYGPLKAACEEVVSAKFGTSAVLVRPGYIVGPHDTSDRFAYWPWRAAQGGKMLAPGVPGAPLQVIDARDLVQWILQMPGDAAGGYNLTGPDRPMTMGEFLSLCNAAGGDRAELHWMNDAALERAGLEGGEFPLWVPAASEFAGIHAVSTSRARATGLRCRPIEQTITDTLSWVRSGRGDRPWRAGVTLEREAEILAGGPGQSVEID